MKRKSLPAILLSMAVIAGAMTITTDAYAQTNTERLATVDARTAETHDLVTGLVESLGFLTGTVTDLHGLVTSVFESVTMVKDSVESTSMKVDALDSKISMVAGDIDANSAQLAELASSVSSDISDVSDAVAANGAAIRDLNDNVQTSINNAVGDLSAKVDTNAAAITEIQNALSGINAQLEEISTSVGVVQQNVDVPVVSDFPAPLVEEKTTEKNVVYLADFVKNTSKQDDDQKYSYEFAFSCEKDVVVQRVSIGDTMSGVTSIDDDRTVDTTTTPPTLGGDGRDADTTDNDDLTVKKNATSTVTGAENPFHIKIGLTDPTEAEISIGATKLLDNAFDIGTGSGVGYVRAASYGDSLLQLTAGSSITFNAKADFTNFISTLIADDASTDPYGTISTADTAAWDIVYAELKKVNQTQVAFQNAQLFTVNIEYIQAGDAKCSISLDEAGDFANSDRTTIRMTPATSDALTSTFEAMVSCNDKVTLFTEGIYVIYDGDNKDQAPDYIEVTLEGGDKKVELVSSSATPNQFSVDANSADSFPIKLESGSLKISGSTLQLNEIVMQLPYQTATGNSCTQVVQ